MVSFLVNGNERRLDVDPEMPLLWALRDVLALKGTKYGCGVGLCGVCTVLVDAVPNHACMVPLGKVAGREVTTIEGLTSAYPERRPLLKAWIELQVPQCGYCQPGQIMAGGIAFGRSAALREEIRIQRGRVAHTSFADYPILTLPEMPEIETHIVESFEHPGGVGEPAVPVIAPAIANAVFAATGRRLRSLPLSLGSTPTPKASAEAAGP